MHGAKNAQRFHMGIFHCLMQNFFHAKEKSFDLFFFLISAKTLSYDSWNCFSTPYTKSYELQSAFGTNAPRAFQDPFPL